MAPSPSTLKWRVLAGYFLSYMFDAVDILILAIAMPAISASLQIGPMQAGLLATATLLGIGMSGLVMGPLADRWGRRKVLLLSLGSFGALTMAVAARHRLARSAGAAVSLGPGPGQRLGHRRRARERNLAGAPARGPPPSCSVPFPSARPSPPRQPSYLLPAHGWRALFFVCGAAVVIAMVYVWRYVPESETWLADRQRKRRRRAAGRARRRPLFAPALLRVTLLGTMVSALTLAAYWGASTWLPTFLQRNAGWRPAPWRASWSCSTSACSSATTPSAISPTASAEKALILSLVCSGLLLPFYVQATDHLLLLWLGPVFAFFMAFAGLMGSYFAELFPTAARGRRLLQRGTRHLRLRAAAAGLDVRHLRLRPEHRRLRRRVHDRRRRGAAAARRQDCRRRRTRRRALSPAAATPQHKQEFRHDAPLRRSVHLPGERCRLRSARLQARDPVLHPRTRSARSSPSSGLKKEDLPMAKAGPLRRSRCPPTMARTWTRRSTSTAPWTRRWARKAAWTIDEVPLEWCFQPGVKLDFRHFGDGYVVTAADVEAELKRIGHAAAAGDRGGEHARRQPLRT